MIDETIITCCRTYGVAVLPGALTPTEIVRAWRAGADMVKVFPCGAMGGATYLKSLKAPLPQIDLVPTGGVSLATVGDFIRAGASAVGAGADLVERLEDAQWERRCRHPERAEVSERDPGGAKRGARPVAPASA